MIDYTQILSTKYKDAEWTLNGDDYEGLTWLSDTPKPTKKTLDDLWAEVKIERENAKVEKIRKKEELLKRLGISEEEAQILLG